ncbi:MAG TPA: type 4a pilus biogenesis protein PilO [Candidatus Saccharimonadales bacterium]|nr:type 4a pilus biogenesis protein PilO [Candidatus Saccharimonadales bacterium]
MKNLKSYLVAIVAIVIVVFLVPTVIIPQFNAIAASYRVVNEDSKIVSQLESKARKLSDLANNVDKLDANLEIAEEALPIEKDVARLVRGIQQLAQTGGLTVTTVKIIPGKTATASATPATSAQTSQPVTSAGAVSPATNTSTANSPKGDLLVELGMTGDDNNFKTFLKALESSKRLLVLSTSKSSATGNNFTYSVVVSAPFGQLPTISADQYTKPLPELSAADKKLLEDLKSSLFTNVTNNPLPTGPKGVTDPFK